MANVRSEGYCSPKRESLPQDPAEPIGLVLAESYPLLLDGMKHAFASAPGFRVLAACADGLEALRAVKRHLADVLIIDLDIRGDALAIHQQIADAQLSTRTLLLTSEFDEAALINAVRAGVKGILLKSMATSQLLHCVRKVHRGDMCLERVSLGRAMDRLIGHQKWTRGAGKALTRRESEVVRLLTSGWHNREIADKLEISEGTVKAHLNHVYEKLGVRGRLELAIYAREKGLFRPTEETAQRL